ncbi:NmrA family NAD(P)-binding protein [Streptomyces sp. AC536]|uniref:NmrA family NAD(P)-binding protein n=1 Tax=Streptomyces buecherae TaxID=2763006 RepID=UPI00164E3B41|nr:NmrA family NAD(P)-binding protein [Streptomyces buecherae]MBC3984845.1 NmrA family NAD(P)-binding protein [Streptomyces buecherae]QNJ40239.1 NmrA family NAD(P)-binding protein [Streptomyces buecherae]
MSADPTPVLVTGATGRQGGATARALLAAGVPVRALVRDPASERARAVRALGAELVTGDLDDRDAVARAAEGARAVFSVQLPDLAGRGFAGEVEHAANLIEGARAAGVPQFVHTSVSGAGQHAAWLAGRWAWMEPYYSAKAGIQDRVRAAGFAHWTLIKPCFFMENLLPAAGMLFPHGVEGGLVTLLRPATRVALVAVADIGAAAAAAVAAPERFAGVELELASDRRTVAEIARVLSQRLGVELAVPDLTEEEATAAGMPDAGFGQAILNEHPQPARPEFARALGIPLTTLDAWAREHLRAAA